MCTFRNPWISTARRRCFQTRLHLQTPCLWSGGQPSHQIPCQLPSTKHAYQAEASISSLGLPRGSSKLWNGGFLFQFAIVRPWEACKLRSSTSGRTVGALEGGFSSVKFLCPAEPRFALTAPIYPCRRCQNVSWKAMLPFGGEGTTFPVFSPPLLLFLGVVIVLLLVNVIGLQWLKAVVGSLFIFPRSLMGAQGLSIESFISE